LWLKLPAGWAGGKPDRGATRELFALLRLGQCEEACRSASPAGSVGTLPSRQANCRRSGDPASHRGFAEEVTLWPWSDRGLITMPWAVVPRQTSRRCGFGVCPRRAGPWLRPVAHHRRRQPSWLPRSLPPQTHHRFPTSSRFWDGRVEARVTQQRYWVNPQRRCRPLLASKRWVSERCSPARRDFQ
jgi:hypothetical protein